MNPVWPERMLILGCGNMGGAMLTGWLAAGLAPERFIIIDPFLKKAPEGVVLHAEISAATGQFDAVLLAIKPQMLDDVVSDLAHTVGADTVLLSILAGVELASLSARLPGSKGVVRIMPNLSAAIGKSPIALAQRGLGPAAQAQVTALMQPLGTPEWFDESLFDAVTALAGSGPAFVYRFIDALAQGAAALGLPAGQAERLALASVEGAALLAAQAGISPGELARKVASPGGTTQAGLDVLDSDGALAGLVAATLRAAAERSAAMAREARAD
jgi:pyrroline-5-carboxylate reductase